MSSDVFGRGYAGQYDLIYEDKDYELECDIIGRAFQRYLTRPVKSILDMGCGTGNHSLALARRGYRVTGVDLSPEMIEIARKKAAGDPSRMEPSAVDFREGDIRSVRVNRRFDAVLMMFAVLGYQLENRDVLAALKTAWKHLRPEGLLLFDVWYGPSVLFIRPGDRAKVIKRDRSEVLRIASPTLDERLQRCGVNYNVWVIEEDRVVSRTTEFHEMRFFFPLELEQLLAACGFTLLALKQFPEIDREPDERCWNVFCVARKANAE